MELWAKRYGTFSIEISNFPSILIWNWSMRHYSMCCHVFLPWNYLHYTQWSLDTHIPLIWSLILGSFSVMNLVHHFLHIYHLAFHLKKFYLPSNFEKILWSNKFLKVPRVEFFIFWTPRWPLLLTKSWTLNLDDTTFSFLYFGILQVCQPNFYWIPKH
jgi:hypothetical protein